MHAGRLSAEKEMRSKFSGKSRGNFRRLRRDYTANFDKVPRRIFSYGSVESFFLFFFHATVVFPSGETQHVASLAARSVGKSQFCRREKYFIVQLSPVTNRENTVLLVPKSFQFGGEKQTRDTQDTPREKMYPRVITNIVRETDRVICPTLREEV